MPASPSKKTGINAELNVSDDLAKIIGTKKGERISRPQVSLHITQHFLKLELVCFSLNVLMTASSKQTFELN